MKHLFIIALLSLSACTSSMMETWLGHPEADLLANWGAPDNTIMTNDGRRVLTWQGRNRYGQIICSKTFTVSYAGFVESYSTSCL